MFRNPIYLLWLIVAAAAAWIAISIGKSRRDKINRSFGNSLTLKSLLTPETTNRRTLKLILQGAGIFFLFMALAGPQWGIELTSSEAPAREVLIAVDTSRSMLTEDVSPNRLEKAKNELELILAGLRTQPVRVGIIAFSGDSSLVCPITTDAEAVREVLRDLQAGMIPTPGTSLGSAIQLASETLSHYAGDKTLIILSDGGDHNSDPVQAAQAAASAGIRIFTIGFGTPEGGPIPLKDSSGNLTGYQKNKKGTTVIAKLREETLSQIAAKTSGSYWRASASQDEIATLLRQISQSPATKGGHETVHSYKNHFLIPLALALIVLIFELLIPEQKGSFDHIQSLVGKISFPVKTESDKEKKSTVATSSLLAFLICFLTLPPLKAAGSEADLRNGNKLYIDQQYAPALNDYMSAAKANPKDPRPVFNAGDALYRLGQYQPASKAFTEAAQLKIPTPLRSAAYYNLGNSAFEQSQYAQAAEAYRNSLLLNPNNPAGAHNLAVALHYLQHPPPKKKDQKKNQQKKNGGGGTPPPPQPRPSSSNQNQQQQNQSQNQLSKDDVQRILSSVTDKKPNTTNQIQKRSSGKAPDGEDW